jgi:hypothetical protein
MRSSEFITESPAAKLAKQMPSLSDYKYSTIGALMKRISTDDNISQDELHNVFVKKYGSTPDHWIKDRAGRAAVRELTKTLPSLSKHDDTTIQSCVKKIASKHKITHSALTDLFYQTHKKKPHHLVKQNLDEDVDSDDDFGSQSIVQEFIEWTAKKLNLQSIPEFEFSTDTQDAQDNHHTGRHTPGDPIWVYVTNRNMVDIFRTVAHEMTHARQDELGMIKPGDSYPGSPIEMLADMVAGKLIKQFGAKHHEIFQ